MYLNRGKLRTDGPLGSYLDFTFYPLLDDCPLWCISSIKVLFFNVHGLTSGTSCRSDHKQSFLKTRLSYTENKSSWRVVLPLCSIIEWKHIIYSQVKWSVEIILAFFTRHLRKGSPDINFCYFSLWKCGVTHTLTKPIYFPFMSNITVQESLPPLFQTMSEIMIDEIQL